LVLGDAGEGNLTQHTVAAAMAALCAAKTDAELLALRLVQPRLDRVVLLEPLEGENEQLGVVGFAALAARGSWMNNGQKVFLTDLHQDMKGYDGGQFAREYRRARLG